MKLNISDRDAFVRAVMHDVPRTDYLEQAHKLVQADICSHMSPRVLAAYEDRTEREYFGARHLYFSPHIASGYYIGALASYQLSEALKVQLEELSAKHIEQSNTHAALRQKLQSIINGCSTLKQAKERLPEFEKYLPDDRTTTGTTQLPAIANVVAELTVLGWPKDKEAA
jgi:hypothetical protein